MRVLCAFLFSLSVFAQQPNALSERDAHYRLQPEDKVEVLYRLTPEFNAQAAVQLDGNVSLPLVGEVKLAGLTLAESAAAIHKKANNRLNEPEITVLLKDYVKPFFTVAGEVARPGRVEIHGQVTLVEAIALSGGFKDSSRRTQVLLFRKASDSMAEVKIFDLRKLMSPISIREDVPMKPGDVLIIPRNTFSKLEPYVRIAESGLLATAQILIGARQP